VKYIEESDEDEELEGAGAGMSVSALGKRKRKVKEESPEAGPGPSSSWTAQRKSAGSTEIQRPVKRVKGKRGVLQQLCEMPLELLFEVR